MGFMGGTFADGLPYSTRAVTIARERGLLSILPMALWAQASALVGRGNFNLGRSAAEEGTRLASDFGHHLGAGWNLTLVAMLDAVRGDEPGRATTSKRPSNSPRPAAGPCRRPRRVGARAARPHVGAAGRGDRPPAACDRPRATRVESADRTVVDPRPDRSGGTLRAARRDRGSIRPLRGLGASARRPPARLSVLARCRALVGEGDTREQFERRSRPTRPSRRSCRPVPSCSTASGCGASARRARRAGICAGRPTSSARSGRRRGRSAPRRSCAPPARRPGGATPRRSTSSPRRSCRSRGSSPPA